MTLTLRHVTCRGARIRCTGAGSTGEDFARLIFSLLLLLLRFLRRYEMKMFMKCSAWHVVVLLLKTFYCVGECVRGVGGLALKGFCFSSAPVKKHHVNATTTQ